MPRRKPVDMPPVMACDHKGAARALGVTTETLRRRVKLRLAPAPLRVPGVGLVWRVHELRDWLNAGCPVPADAPTWVWKPAQVMPLDEYLAGLHRRIREAQAQAQELEEMRAKGETQVSVRIQ